MLIKTEYFNICLSLNKQFKDRKGADQLNKMLQKQLVIFQSRPIFDNYSLM